MASSHDIERDLTKASVGYLSKEDYKRKREELENEKALLVLKRQFNGPAPAAAETADSAAAEEPSADPASEKKKKKKKKVRLGSFLLCARALLSTHALALLCLVHAGQGKKQAEWAVIRRRARGGGGGAVAGSEGYWWDVRGTRQGGRRGREKAQQLRGD